MPDLYPAVGLVRGAYEVVYADAGYPGIDPAPLMGLWPSANLSGT